jgi:hypothetical protein
MDDELHLSSERLEKARAEAIANLKKISKEQASYENRKASKKGYKSKYSGTME